MRLKKCLGMRLKKSLGMRLKAQDEIQTYTPSAQGMAERLQLRSRSFDNCHVVPASETLQLGTPDTLG